jgi:hypothetical protein
MPSDTDRPIASHVVAIPDLLCFNALASRLCMAKVEALGISLISNGDVLAFL